MQTDEKINGPDTQAIGQEGGGGEAHPVQPTTNNGKHSVDIVLRP